MKHWCEWCDAPAVATATIDGMDPVRLCDYHLGEVRSEFRTLQIQPLAVEVIV